MAARVVKGTDFSCLIAQDDDRARADLKREIVARPADFRFKPGEQPLAVKNRIEIELERCRVAVQGARQAVSGLPRGKIMFDRRNLQVRYHRHLSLTS